MVWIWKCTLVALVAARGLAAQAPSPQFAPRPFPVEPDVSSPIFAGAGLGLVGFGVGGLIGYATVRNHCDRIFDDFCGFEEFFLGAAVGGTFGMAAGVHLGNRGRGNLATDFVTGALVWGGGIGLAAATGWDNSFATIVLVAIPIAQLAATTSVERSMGRRRERAHALTVSLMPRRGGLGFVASLPLPRIR